MGAPFFDERGHEVERNDRLFGKSIVMHTTQLRGGTNRQ